MNELKEQIEQIMKADNIRKCEIYKTGLIPKRTVQFFFSSESCTITTLLKILKALNLEIKIVKKGIERCR